MTKLIRQCATALGWGFPLARTLASREPVILVYHGVPHRDAHITGEVLEQHVRFLQHHFDIVSIQALGSSRSRSGRIRVVLTFDDSLSNHAEVVAPILRKYRVPAIFFISSRHADPGRYLWFTYLRMLERHFSGKGFVFRDQFMDMSPGARTQTVALLREWLLQMRPHPAAMYEAIKQELPPLGEFAPQDELRDHAAGMTREQVHELAQDALFSFGVHTVDHPLLSLCHPSEVTRQISENRHWIEVASRRPCDLIAYPLSDYNADVLEQCYSMGFRWGFSVEHKIEGDTRLQLPRVGIYFPSATELGCKVRWGNLITTWKRRLSPAPASTAGSRPAPPQVA